jgi:hypothetical protein
MITWLYILSIAEELLKPLGEELELGRKLMCLKDVMRMETK